MFSPLSTNFSILFFLSFFCWSYHPCSRLSKTSLNIPLNSLDLGRFVQHYILTCVSGFETAIWAFSIWIPDIARVFNMNTWNCQISFAVNNMRCMRVRHFRNNSCTFIKLFTKETILMPMLDSQTFSCSITYFCNIHLASSNLGSSMDIRFRSTWKSLRQLRFWSFNSW